MKEKEELDSRDKYFSLEGVSRVVRFAGDSGDGIQLIGERFTQTSGSEGRGVLTFPDFPAEIRAPAGSLFGVSSFQVHLGAREIKTSGDILDVMVALNPAALKVNLGSLPKGCILIVDEGSFTDRGLSKAKFDSNPLDDGTLSDYRLWSFDITSMVKEAVKEHGLGNKDSVRWKNMWVLGLIYWLFEIRIEDTIEWLSLKFGKETALGLSNIAALKSGNAFAETVELPQGIEVINIGQDKHRKSGFYRVLTGTKTLSYGLMAGAYQSQLEMVYCSYPITPASPLLHEMANNEDLGVKVFQGEDEISAIGAAIGVSYGGGIGVTGTSGPGLSLMSESLGLAVSVELPLIVVDAQRGGPSTGLPTKTEQSDLFLAVCGRHGDAPLVVLAPRSPADCFEVGFEAVRISLSLMVPVIILTDGFISNSSEPWRIVELEGLPLIKNLRVTNGHDSDGEKFFPYDRDPKTLARSWAVPGDLGKAHRIGGIERDQKTGNVSYDPDNHSAMTKIRSEKVKRVLEMIPALRIDQGEDIGKLLLVTWGSTYGVASRTVERCILKGEKVSHLHIRYVSPLDPSIGEIMSGFDKILVVELNNGQLKTLIHSVSKTQTNIESYTKVSGQPISISELLSFVELVMKDG